MLELNDDDRKVMKGIQGRINAVAKGGLPPGTVHDWGDGPHVKQSDGTWKKKRTPGGASGKPADEKPKKFDPSKPPVPFEEWYNINPKKPASRTQQFNAHYKQAIGQGKTHDEAMRHAAQTMLDEKNAPPPGMKNPGATEPVTVRPEEKTPGHAIPKKPGAGAPSGKPSGAPGGKPSIPKETPRSGKEISFEPKPEHEKRYKVDSESIGNWDGNEEAVAKRWNREIAPLLAAATEENDMGEIDEPIVSVGQSRAQHAREWASEQFMGHGMGESDEQIKILSNELKQKLFGEKNSANKSFMSRVQKSITALKRTVGL